MNEDDVDSDELALLPDGLGGHLADVCHKLQLQIRRGGAAVARAQVRRDVVPLEVERQMQARRGEGRERGAR